jgi:hypothetical protein
MPKIFAMLVSLQIGAVVPALAMDKITYLACKAENEGAASVVGLDDTTQKVCDRSVEAFWFAPPAFGPAKVIWNDGLYTKAIYRTGSDKRYEQNFLLLVHRGHCHKVEPATSQSCNLQ